MKALKILGFFVLLIAVLVFILNMMAPNDYRVERSITIDAPAKTTFRYLKHFEKMSLWSPWEEKDPNIKSTITGTDGTVGAIHSWEGNDEVGVGSQEIVAIEPLKRVDTRLRFLKPWESESDAFFTMEPEGEKQKVTWGFTGSSAFPENIMMMMMGGIDKAVGSDYEKGLAKLKTLVEADKSDKLYNGYRVETIDRPATFYVGTRKEVEMDKITAFYEKHLSTTLAAVTKNKGEMAGMPSGLFYTWDEKTGKTDMAAAIPVKAKMTIDGYESFEFPAGKALLINYFGDYAGSEKAHLAMEAYLKETGLTAKYPCFEEYVTDPTTEKNPKKWLTKVYYMLDATK